MRVSKLDHNNQPKASQIWKLFHSAYEIETQVLGLQNFPPLNRTALEIQEASTTFFGGWQDSLLVAMAEIEHIGVAQFHINSFGVSPDHFRQGFGSQLLTGLLDELVWQRITVTTAVANIPALNLYQKLGFQQHNHRITPDNFQMTTLLLEKTAQ